MALFFVLGLYAGGVLFLLLTHADMSLVRWDTLFWAWGLPVTDERFPIVPWASCVTAGLTFLPGIVMLMAFYAPRFRKAKLHGNARFANDRELRPYLYRGNYSK